jgi:nitrous oxidase accessory protein NosD
MACRQRPTHAEPMEMRLIHWILFLGLLALATLGNLPAPAAAATLRVPEDEATVAGALGRAARGDTLLVGPGRYSGCVRVPNEVVLIAIAGPDSTFLDGAGRGPVVTFEEAGPMTLLDGFTVTGGVIEDERGDGAGIRCARHSSPRINHNHITGNRALGKDSRGGGIACLDGSHPTIANNRIEGNEAAYGGGIYVGKRRGWDSSPVVSSNYVVRNRARERGGGIAITHTSEALLTLNVVAWNVALAGGAGLSIERAQPRIMENVVWANTDSSATASGILMREYAAPTIERNIVAANRGGAGVTCELQFQERQEFRCNLVWGNRDGQYSDRCALSQGNRSADPEFCDPEHERFGLRSASPCLHDPDCGRIGAFGVACEAVPPRATEAASAPDTTGGARSPRPPP